MRKTSPERLSNSPNVTSKQLRYLVWLQDAAVPVSSPDSVAQIQKAAKAASSLPNPDYTGCFTSRRVGLQLFHLLGSTQDQGYRARFDSKGLRKSLWASAAKRQQAGAFGAQVSEQCPAHQSSRQTAAAKLSHDVRQAPSQSQMTPPPRGYWRLGPSVPRAAQVCPLQPLKEKRAGWLSGPLREEATPGASTLSEQLV